MVKMLEKILRFIKVCVFGFLKKNRDIIAEMDLEISEHEEKLKDLKKQKEQSLADVKLFEKRISQNEALIKVCLSEAKKSDERGQIEIVKELLAKKVTAEDELVMYKNELTKQQAVYEKLKVVVQDVDDRLAERKAERERLVIRKHSADAIKKSHEVLSTISGDFKDFQTELDKLECQADAAAEISSEEKQDVMEIIKKSNKSARIDAELQKLRETK